MDPARSPVRWDQMGPTRDPPRRPWWPSRSRPRPRLPGAKDGAYRGVPMEGKRNGDAKMTGGAAVRGLAAGFAGGAGGTAPGKMEEGLTSRAQPVVPRHTMERLPRRPPQPDEAP